MPDNPSPAAQPERSSEAIEFNFDKPASEIPRIKRRSLKGKTPGLKPASTPPAARDLEREAPPLSDETTAKPVAPAATTSPVRTEPARATPVAPPRTTPIVTTSTASVTASPAAATARPAASIPASSTAHASAQAQKPGNGTGVSPSASGQKVNIALTSHQKATAAVLTASTPHSPHGTRPATLYYTSPKKEATDSMKTTPTATTTPSSSATAARPAQATNASTSATRPATSATAPSATATRPVATTTPTRPAATNFDYRANVDRQTREQKSVGSILAYFVYGLIAFFVLAAGLATYGSVVIFDKLHDQATSISGLDDKYSQKVDELNKRLAATQDSLIQAQAQNARQLDLLNKQEEEINQLRAALNAASSASAEAIHAEAHARSQEAASLRARIRDLEYRTSLEQTTVTRP